MLDVNGGAGGRQTGFAAESRTRPHSIHPRASLPESVPGASTPHDGYQFLLDSGLSTAILIEAIAAARDWQVPLPDALIALGAMTEAQYAGLVAQTLGVDLATDVEVVGGPPLMTVAGHQVRRHRDSTQGPKAVLAATAGPMHLLQEAKHAVSRAGFALVIAPATAMTVAIERADRTRALRHATTALVRHRPHLSAARGLASWQALALAITCGLIIGGTTIAPGHTLMALLVLMTVPFVGVVLVRLVAVAAVFRPQPALLTARDPDSALPAYTVLVPLFNEAEVIDALVASLSRLDYPPAKLDIILVLEEADVATKLALLTTILPRAMRVIVVPEAQPRTKPKALNYAMQFARGDFVVVFDAEDRPEPDQLRKAIAAFRTGPDKLACVQARLNIYNPHDSWYTRQFTIEYSALFDAILPALDWLRLPVPLGGTSNHFPRALLQEIGGWDPFNVTEDADLGIRLARLGHVTQVLDSTTWEEAPLTWQQWKPQRTRWLKGWYQTYLVHTRKPGLLFADLGLWRTLGFHVFLGGIILSTLAHPFLYALLAWTALAGDSLALPSAFQGAWLWWIAVGTLVLGYASAILVGAVAAHRRGHGLLLWALAMPLNWLQISYASYRALWQLWRDPFLWEKTTHGRSLRRATMSRDSGGEAP